MSKKIIYWTGVYSPEKEAVSKEVHLLHTNFSSSIVYGISSYDWLRFSLKQRYIVHFYRPYRLVPRLIPLISSRFDLSHIYHSLHNHYFLDNLSKKPIILTAATGGAILEPARYEKIDRIVLESAYDLERVRHAGIPEEKLSLIYPGLDLSDFSYQEPDQDFTILFASSPFSSEYFGARGIDLLIAAAAACQDVRFLLLWRRWSGTVQTITPMVQGKTNIILNTNIIRNMGTFLNGVHAVIAPFTSPMLTKPCPNSIIEGLAAGKPALVSDKVSIAHLIEQEQCGIVFPPEKGALVAAIHELKKNYRTYQQHARHCAERYFSKDIFLAQYESLYNDLL